jgi:succinate dehydrogenase/fumarate reductase flavoprotein subunit
MDGDLALCEASHSLEEFFHLVAIGVDFPHNRYGEFAGYKTDHDPLQRASSIGPYTSKKMTEQLEGEVRRRDIRIIDKSRAVKLIIRDGRACGILCLENGNSFRVYFSKNIIFAAGGPPGMYQSSVYPPSQFGASGILAREGVRFSNLAEWQYGIASVKFRWNLSGSYQQVIPRYISVDAVGTETEFLRAYFSSAKNLGRAVFLKGYQWPFDPGKIAGEGSSLVDLAIYIEKHVRGNRVYIDYLHNPAGFSPDAIDETAREYLAKSNALGASPVERLLQLNPLSYELYKSHGIDLAKEYLELDVVPQHHNGGAEVNIWWETSVKHLFAIGECAGTHGVQRPGGSALNAGQVGGLRAASYIAGHYAKDDGFYAPATLALIAGEAIGEFEKEFDNVTGDTPTSGNSGGFEAGELLARLQEMNTRTAAFIRPRQSITESIKALEHISREKVRTPENLAGLFKLKEMILLSRLMYDAILAFVNNGGKSRGSYLIIDSVKNIEACLGGVETDLLHQAVIISTCYKSGDDKPVSELRPVRPIPESDTWFEQVWREYREGEIFSP